MSVSTPMSVCLHESADLRMLSADSCNLIQAVDNTSSMSSCRLVYNYTQQTRKIEVDMVKYSRCYIPTIT